MSVTVEGAVDHHLQRRLGLGDPAHAMGQAGRTQPVLAKKVALAATTQHLALVYPQVFDDDFGVTGTAVHGFDLADFVPALRRNVDNERRVGRLRKLGVVLGAGDEDGEAGPVGIGDEPLVAVDHPLLSILIGVGLNECRVRARHLRFGHGETRPGPTLAQRFQILLGLLRRGPVQQGVHVALVRGLAIEHPRSVVRTGGFGLHHGQVDVTQAHAAPLRRHVRQPDTGFFGLTS